MPFFAFFSMNSLIHSFIHFFFFFFFFFSYMQTINHLRPEIDSFLRFLLYRFTVAVDRPSPGNALQNLTFNSTLGNLTFNSTLGSDGDRFVMMTTTMMMMIVMVIVMRIIVISFTIIFILKIIINKNKILAKCIYFSASFFPLVFTYIFFFTFCKHKLKMR